MTTEAGRVLARKLKARKWSQERLRKEMNARGVKMPVGLICKWIAGTHEPNIARAVLLQDLLNINVRLWTVPSSEEAA